MTVEIPIVDIGPLIDGTDPEAVAEGLRRASHEVGFIYISGHGLDVSRLDEVRDTALSFFRAGAEDKAGVTINEHHRGWLAPGQSRMETDDKPDLKESFVWGSEGSGGPDSHPLQGPNRWPEDVPELAESAQWFSSSADAVARVVLRGFAIGLGLEADHFVATSDDPLSRASFAYYPPQADDSADDEFGVAPHTDFGVLTILRQDEVGGLEVQTADGEWIAAPPVPDTLVVNVGDLLDRWTNGYYRSTPHRVINSSGQERLSLVYAFDPNAETMIDATTVLPQQQPAFPPITAGDYLIKRFARSFDYRNADEPA